MVGKKLGWVATALVVTIATSVLPERSAHAIEPVTTTAVIVGSTIGAGLPAGLSGLGAGTGVYAYTFTGVSLGSVSGGVALTGGVAIGAAVIAGVAIVGALAVGGYFLYKYIEKKRAEDARIASAGSNVRRDAITIATGSAGRGVTAPRAAGAGMPR